MVRILDYRAAVTVGALLAQKDRQAATSALLDNDQLARTLARMSRAQAGLPPDAARASGSGSPESIVGDEIARYLDADDAHAED